MIASIVAGLISAVALTAGAEQQRIGDWVVTASSELRIASTTNDAGASVGVLCFLENERCLSFIVTQDSCRNGATVPMMLNSAVGSSTVTTVCRHFPGDREDDVTMMSVVSEYDTMRSALESGGIVGIAIPMASGSFHVLRFSTGGATQAIRWAMTVPAERPERSKSVPAASSYL